MGVRHLNKGEWSYVQCRATNLNKRPNGTTHLTTQFVFLIHQALTDVTPTWVRTALHPSSTDHCVYVCFLQMEELVGSRHSHTSHDLLLLLHHLPGPHGAYDDSEYKHCSSFFCSFRKVGNTSLRLMGVRLTNNRIAAPVIWDFPLNRPVTSFVSVGQQAKAHTHTHSPDAPVVLLLLMQCFSLQVLCVQIKCFQEIITIGYSVYHSYHLPWFRTLSWWGHTESTQTFTHFRELSWTQEISSSASFLLCFLMFYFVADLPRFVFRPVLNCR